MFLLLARRRRTAGLIELMCIIWDYTNVEFIDKLR